MGTRLVVALALLVSLCPAGAARADHEVELRWTAAESPYVLDETFVVDQHTLLVIESGVGVLAAPGAALDVVGSLEVQGTPDSPVTFSEMDAGAGWLGIRLHGGPARRATMDHASVADATTALVLGIPANLNEVELRDNGTAIEIANPWGDVTVTDSRIYNNFEALVGRTRHRVGVYDSDLWNNEMNVVPSPQKAYDCGSDDGLWDLHDNDILHGPTNTNDGRWDAFTPEGSGASPYVVTMTDNWWGSDSMDFVQARLGIPWRTCCPTPFYKEIVVAPLSTGPNTSWEPPGEVFTQVVPWSIGHGDPGAISEIARPHHGDCYRAEELPRLRGDVYPAVGGALEVELGLSRKTRDGWTHVFSGVEPRYEEKSYGRSWSYRLRRSLRPGRYELRSWTGSEPQHLGRNIVKFRITR